MKEYVACVGSKYMNKIAKYLWKGKLELEARGTEFEGEMPI